jgi:hypothetical protein
MIKARTMMGNDVMMDELLRSPVSQQAQFVQQICGWRGYENSRCNDDLGWANLFVQSYGSFHEYNNIVLRQRTPKLAGFNVRCIVEKKAPSIL